MNMHLDKNDQLTLTFLKSWTSYLRRIAYY